jgi:hypothetical protein
MQPSPVASLDSDRRTAIAWLTNQLRWERTLAALRSKEDRPAEQAA